MTDLDGKNASSAFALSSGTIGAAMAASLSSYPSIALSYGVIQRPVPPRAIQLAHEVSVEIIARLWADWGKDESERYHYRHETEAAAASGDVDNEVVRGKGKGRMDMRGKVALYCVNVPLIEEKLEPQTRKIWWTRMWRNGYGQLFREKEM
jgi:broad specificity polyphosphatase/5'/3'-nucleotidase SurE